MLTLREPLDGQRLVDATFMRGDVPDERLFQRMQVMGEGMLPAFRLKLSLTHPGCPVIRTRCPAILTYGAFF